VADDAPLRVDLNRLKDEGEATVGDLRCVLRALENKP
jgi:hypothetical protein